MNYALTSAGTCVRFQPTGNLANCALGEAGVTGIVCKSCNIGFEMLNARTRQCSPVAVGSSLTKVCKSHGIKSTGQLMCLICRSGFMRDGRGSCTRAVVSGCLEANRNVCRFCDYTNGYYEIGLDNNGGKQCKLSGRQLIFGARATSVLSVVLVVVAMFVTN